jgi:hypothetical protein
MTLAWLQRVAAVVTFCWIVALSRVAEERPHQACLKTIDSCICGIPSVEEGCRVNDFWTQNVTSLEVLAPAMPIEAPRSTTLRDLATEEVDFRG